MTGASPTTDLLWQLARPEDQQRWWVRDNLYTLQPRTPLSDSVFTAVWDECTLYQCEAMKIPDARGFNARTVNGYTYLSPIPIADGAVIEKRLAEFLDLIRTTATTIDEHLVEVHAAQAPEHAYWEAADLDTDNVLLLLEYWRRVQLTLDRFWKLHFSIVFPRHAVAGTFENEARDEVGIQSAAEIGRLVQAMGMTGQMTFDAALWSLSGRAIELGLRDAFLGTLESELEATLESSDAGREWLGELRAFLAAFGARSTLPMELADPTWGEEPTPVLGTIRTYVAEGGEYDFEHLVAERERDQAELERTTLAGITDDGKREHFIHLLYPARKLQAAMEDDNVELFWANTQVRLVALEIGRRLVGAGALADPTDIFFLRKGEVEQAIVDLGVGLYDLGHYGELARERRAEWEGFRRAKPPAYIGDVPDEIHDLLLNQFWGIRGRTQLDDVDGELTGVGASGGVVEGIARLVTGAEQFGQVQPGEILVCQSTNPAWTPLFSKVAAVVADQGGTLSHAAIVAREYGIPAVLGTGHATTRIADGARVRVDGDAGTVVVL